MGVVAEQLIVANLKGAGFTVSESKDGISYRILKDGKEFSIPKALDDNSYTQAQWDYIEQTLAFYGFDIRPLDMWLSPLN
ncbi:MAG: hypothetical protein IH995_04870 [Proteobacteria bacterium]|nr:hypothetical protein [Pseudomonadota bacterium]